MTLYRWPCIRNDPRRAALVRARRTPMICQVPAYRLSAFLGAITAAGNLIAQRLQPLRKRDQLVLETVDSDPVTVLRDLPEGLQCLLEARDGVVDVTQPLLICRHE